MIRMLFAMLLAVGALVGASLRFQRERDERAAAAEPAPPPVVHTVDLGEPDASRSRPALPTPPARGRASAPEPVAVAELEEEEIPALRSATFVEAPLAASDGAPPATSPGIPSGASDGPARVASLDQDAWAELIRRMLALYARAQDER